MIRRLAHLFRADPEEDRRLEELEIPTVVWYAGHLGGLALLSLAIYMTVARPEGLLEGDATARGLAAGFLGLAALPWALELGRQQPIASKIFLPLWFGPLAAIGLLRHLDVLDLHHSAVDIVRFAVLVVVVPDLAGGPRRVATATVLSAAGIYGLWSTTMWGSDGDSGISDVAIWLIALVFTTCAAATYRFALLTMVKAREAHDQLARQETADERRQVAQDIHDVVAHTLAVTMLHVTAARMAVRRDDPEEAEEALEEAERHGRASLDDVRRIVRLLRTDDAPSVGAAQPDLRDVEDLVESYRGAGLTVDLSLQLDDGTECSPTVELAVYRVLQEALTNAARHGSGPAKVRLATTDHELTLEVDNPVDLGTEPLVDAERSGRHRRQGSGLVGMRERIATVDGTINIGVEDGRWVVTTSVPFNARAGSVCSKPQESAAGNGAPAQSGPGWRWHPRVGTNP